MAKATITLEDQPDGSQQINIDFGDGVDRTSPAHHLAALMLMTAKEAHEGDQPAVFTPGPRVEPATKPHPVTGA